MAHVSKEKTPWAVRCDEHGQVFMTTDGYMAQMRKPNARWVCPICGELSNFDDLNFEEHGPQYEEED